MARARAARYSELESRGSTVGAELIATGHHADDRAETMLERLLRGAGAPRLGRPARALRQSGADLSSGRAARMSRPLDDTGLHTLPDPTNLDRRFVRTRLRLDVLPLLEGAVAENRRAFSPRWPMLWRARVARASGWSGSAGEVGPRADASASTNPGKTRLLRRGRALGPAVGRLSRGTGQPEVLESFGPTGAAKPRKSD